MTLRLPAELLNKIQAEIMEAVKKNAMTSPAVWWAIAASDSINAAHACGLKPHEIIEFHRDEIEKFCAAMEELPSTHDQHEAIQRSVRFWRGLLENGDTKSEGLDREASVAGADVTAAGTMITVFQRVRGSEYRYQPTNVVELVVSDAKDVAPFVDPRVESTLVSVEICEEAVDEAYGEMRSRLKAACSLANARVQLDCLGVALHDADGRPRAPMDISSDIKEKLAAITDSIMRAQVEKTLSPWINPIGPLFPGEFDDEPLVAGARILTDGKLYRVVDSQRYKSVGARVVEQRVDGKVITASDIWKDTIPLTDPKPGWEELCAGWRNRALAAAAEVQRLQALEKLWIETEARLKSELEEALADRERWYEASRRGHLDRLKAEGLLAERSDECLALQDKIAKLIEARPTEARLDEPELFPANALRF